MTRYVFEEVTRRASKVVKCAGCGKTVRRRRTFMQTLNPFNKNAAGDPKTRSEIWIELDEQAGGWQAEPERCIPCLRAALRADAQVLVTKNGVGSRVEQIS